MTQIGDFYGNDGLWYYYLEDNKFVRFEEDYDVANLKSTFQIEILSEECYTFTVKSIYNFIEITIAEEGIYLNDELIDGPSSYPLINSIYEKIGIDHKKLYDNISDLENPVFNIIKQLMADVHVLATKILFMELPASC